MTREQSGKLVRIAETMDRSMNRRSAHSPIFETGSVRAVELDAKDIPALRQFIETNSKYFVAVTGQPPRYDEAHKEFHDELPDRSR